MRLNVVLNPTIKIVLDFLDIQYGGNIMVVDTLIRGLPGEGGIVLPGHLQLLHHQVQPVPQLVYLSLRIIFDFFKSYKQAIKTKCEVIETRER